MARIGAKNTKPEMFVGRALHAAGFRYSLHSTKLPGRPDLVLSEYRAVIFVHGCFWHGHDCRHFRLPATRTQFWQAKIDGNRARDDVVTERLTAAGWRVAVVWECIQRDGTWTAHDLVTVIKDWLAGSEQRLEVR